MREGRMREGRLMRVRVFGRPAFSREDMEREAAQELEAAVLSAPQPPDPSLASWAPPGGWPAPPVLRVVPPLPADEDLVPNATAVAQSRPA